MGNTWRGWRMFWISTRKNPIRSARWSVLMKAPSTHSAASLYTHFPPQEARRIMRKIEFHYTPKHASWLNMVEIEIGVMRTQCLDRRIAAWAELESEIAIWQRRRNTS